MKKTIYLLFLLFLVVQCQEIPESQKKKSNGEETNYRREIYETITNFFVVVDNKDWDIVSEIFSDTVLLDYTSMAGGEPAYLPAEQIIDTWKGFLPGFDHTHHQLGNYIIQIDENKGYVFCYGTATHYLKNDTGENVWTVVGSYDLEVELFSEVWQITKLKFNLKYVDGNLNLPQMAQQKMQNS
jgi:hypothetical protein